MFSDIVRDVTKIHSFNTVEKLKVSVFIVFSMGLTSLSRTFHWSSNRKCNTSHSAVVSSVFPHLKMWKRAAILGRRLGNTKRRGLENWTHNGKLAVYGWKTMSSKVWLICDWCIENKQTLMAETVLSSTRFINGCTKWCQKKLGEREAIVWASEI